MTDNPLQGRNIRAIATGTALAIIVALAASWLFNYLLLFSDGLTAFTRSAIVATVLPIVLAGPLAAFALWQRQEMRKIRQASARASARDSATGFVSQNVLSAVVEERRKNVPATAGAASGALLLLEISELRRINARFGPEWSASALTVMGNALRKSVRSGDLVGRLATGEFGIFLPDATQEDAQRVGERLIDAVAAIYFAPEGIESTIKMHVAGVVFDHEVHFAEAIRQAAEQLSGMPDKEKPAVLIQKAAAMLPHQRAD